MAEQVQWMRDNWVQGEAWAEGEAGSPVPQETSQDMIAHPQPGHASSNFSVDGSPADGNPAERGLGGGVTAGAEAGSPAEQWQKASMAAQLQSTAGGQVMHTPVLAPCGARQ